MFGRLFRNGVAALLLASGALGGFLVPTARGQTPSDLDTMRILDQAALPGDTVTIDFYLRNVMALGGYTFRLRYDPALIEPLIQIVAGSYGPEYYIQAEQLRGNSFEFFGGGVEAPGALTFAAFDLPTRGVGRFQPGAGSAVRMRWRVLATATPQVTPIVFENHPDYPQSWNMLGDTTGVLSIRPVMTAGNFSILAPSCARQGDVNNNGLRYEIGDLVYLLRYTFNDGEAPPKDLSCTRVNRGDLTCDGVVDVMDIIVLSEIIAGDRQPGADGCQ